VTARRSVWVFFGLLAMGEVAGIAFLPAGAAAQDEPPQIAWRHLAERYSVSGLPTILVGERRVVGFVRAKEMLAVLRAAEKKPTGQFNRLNWMSSSERSG